MTIENDAPIIDNCQQENGASKPAVYVQKSINRGSLILVYTYETGYDIAILNENGTAGAPPPSRKHLRCMVLENFCMPTARKLTLIKQDCYSGVLAQIILHYLLVLFHSFIRFTPHQFGKGTVQ